jgi:hypothetical protein
MKYQGKTLLNYQYTIKNTEGQGGK